MDTEQKWYCISESTLLQALRAVQAGASPDLVILELVANEDMGEVTEGDE